VKVTGDLGGTTGADQLCTKLASAAGRPGAKAYVSVAGELPVQQWIVYGQSQPSGVIWYGPQWSNEHGVPMGNADVWLGSAADCVAGASCRGWTSASAGEVGVSGPPYESASRPAFNFPFYQWPDAGTSTCDTRRAVLCVHHERPFSLFGAPRLPAPTKRLFVTRAEFPGALGGVSGANQRCLDTARDGGFQGSWRAVLSTSGAPFSSAHDGGWSYRLDDDAGAVFQTAQNLGTTPRHGFSVDEHGASLDGGSLWTGTGLWLTPTTLDCAGWTSADGGGTTGTLGRLDETWSNDGVTSCASSAHLLCLED
jgi:hypothetical protein